MSTTNVVQTAGAALLVLFAALALSGCSGDDPFAPEAGVWRGYADGMEVVTLYINGGAITSTGSPLDEGASLIIKLPYSGVTITHYVYDDIGINGKQFSFDRGSPADAGGRLEIEGTFDSSTRLTGSVTHDEDSFQARAHLEYDWVAEQ